MIRRKLIQIGQNGQLLHTQQQQCITKPPKYHGMEEVLVVQGFCTCLDIWEERLFWLHFECVKSAQKFTR